MKRSVVAAVLVLGSALAGCSPMSPEGGADTDGTSDSSAVTTATTYVGIQDFGGSIYEGAWYDINSKLTSEFNAVCGDTFCEGDFSNLTSGTFSCAVTSKAGDVSDCVWTFFGSLASVDPATSAITVDAPTFQCHVHPKTTAKKLVGLLSTSSDAIHETLPGTTGSIYDELVDCFQHPIGATPISFPHSDAPTYVEASDYYATAANQAKWAKAKQNLVDGFNNICGDTFCGSDYSDLQSLQFVCSVTKSTGNVKACEWIFGGSSHWVVSNQKSVQIDAKTWSCPVPVKGTMSQLVTTLTSTTDTTDPIHRPLPGETTSAYDALGGCLP
jgi:hypothetical protein